MRARASRLDRCTFAPTDKRSLSAARRAPPARTGAHRADNHASRFAALIGNATATRQILSLIERVAETDATVLIGGETGTGKELVARALHEASRRRDATLVTVNCAALPTELFESEFFGHVRGSFTDARTDKQGLFVQAHRGTLFLDEIAEMPLPIQAKLLRAIEVRAVRPVGAREEMPVDVRLVAATHRALKACVAAGSFREDLYYRLDVVTLTVPPLRDRGTDILPLARAFLAQFARQYGRPEPRISPAAAERLVAYPWPGNVRELRNCMERAMALSSFDELDAADLPEHIAEAVPIAGPRRLGEAVPHDAVGTSGRHFSSGLVSLAELERRHVEQVVQAVDHNMSRAAQILGVDRTTLYRMIKRWSSVGREAAQ